MAQAAGNRAMRQLLERPALAAERPLPVKQELALVPSPLVAEERPPGPELLPIAVRERPIWWRFWALSGWGK
jgi:hypothetical protein